MIHYLIVHCIPNFKATPLRLIDYVTFRAGAAAFTALLLVLLLVLPLLLLFFQQIINYCKIVAGFLVARVYAQRILIGLLCLKQ